MRLILVEIIIAGKMMDRELGALRDFQRFLSRLGTVPDNKIKFYILHDLKQNQNRLKARFEIDTTACETRGIKPHAGAIQNRTIKTKYKDAAASYGAVICKVKAIRL